MSSRSKSAKNRVWSMAALSLDTAKDRSASFSSVALSLPTASMMLPNPARSRGVSRPMMPKSM